MKPLPVLPFLACLLFCGCATKEAGRARLVAPAEIGAAYSEVEMQAQLALTPDARCPAEVCEDAELFRLRVEGLGLRLTGAAARVAVETGRLPPRFDIVVPGKEDIGTLSSASGRVVVFDGLRDLDLPEPALAFLIAREMGHVLAEHHEENVATSLAISLGLYLLFPIAGLLQGAETAYTATTLTSGVASSAASFAGTRILRNVYRADQRREADELALRILAHADWTLFETAAAVRAVAPRLIGGGWMEELRDSQAWLDRIAIGPPPQLVTAGTQGAPAASAGPLAAVSMRHEDFGPVATDVPNLNEFLLLGTPTCRSGRLPVVTVRNAVAPAAKKLKPKAKKRKSKAKKRIKPKRVARR